MKESRRSRVSGTSWLLAGISTLSTAKRLPLAGDALELLGAAVRKRDTRADDEVLDGARDEHLVRAGERADPRADVDGHAADVVADELALAGVQAGSHA